MRRSLSPRAFTLLEMMISLMITAMIVFTVYRFVSAHLTTIRTSVELGEEREALEVAVKMVQGQLSSLPATQSGALVGKAYKFRGFSNDELTWTCSPGSGLLTTAASGQYQVTLTVQPVSEKASETELGLRRRPAPGNKDSTDIELGRGGGDERYNWLPLIRPMAMLEVRYYDPLSNTWADKWSDPGRLPLLVRLRLQKRPDDAPMEAVISIPSAQVNR